MKSKVINVLMLVVSATLILILAFYVRVGVTADSVAVLKTVGMTCGSCSSKISKALETLQGVAVTEVDVEGGWVIVGYEKKNVKPEALAARVKSSGFNSNVHLILTPEQFREATGRDIGKSAESSGCGGCGPKGGGCGSNKKS